MGTRGNVGTGVRVSILKPTPIIFTESWPIYLFFKSIHPFISYGDLKTSLQMTLITRNSDLCKCENKGLTVI